MPYMFLLTSHTFLPSNTLANTLEAAYRGGGAYWNGNGCRKGRVMLDGEERIEKGVACWKGRGMLQRKWRLVMEE